MAKEAIGSNATFTGPQAGLTIIGNHCYAYSGIVAVDNNETSLLAFATGKEYVKTKLQITNASDTARDSRYKVYLNEQIIYQYGTDVSGEYGSEEDPDPPLNIIIPPLTAVKVTAMNSENTDSINQVAILTGKVYQ